MSLFKDITEARKELERLRTEYNSLTSKPAPIFDTKNIDEANAAVEAMGKSVKQTKKDLNDLERGFGGIYNEVKGILSELTKVGTPTKDITKEFRTQEKLLTKLKNDQQGFGKLSLKELKTLKEKQNISAQNIRDKAKDLILAQGMKEVNGDSLNAVIKHGIENGKISEEQAAIIRGAKEGFTVLKETNDELDNRITKEEQINKNLGLGGNLIKGVGGALKKMGMGGLASQLGLDEAQKKMRKVAEEMENSKSKLTDMQKKRKVLSAGFDSMKSSLGKNLTDPLTIGLFLFKGIFDAVKAVDKQSGELAKNLNISYSEATELSSELSKAANQSGSVTITAAGLGEALMAANGELGIFNTTIDDNLILFQKLHKTAGLTYQELSGIKSITDATGGDLEKNTKELLAQSRLTGQKFGVALNEKDVMKEISNVSKATTLSLGMSTKELSNAVSTAQALGMEMSQIEGIANSLLNFESSIEKELEAELLLGKDINLEKARQAALNNDLATVAEEIAKQAGSAADFGKMNRLQQEALAGAVGMSREELAKSLFVQEQIGNLTGDEYELRKKQIEELEGKGLSQKQIAAELGKQSLDDLKHQNSVQERLNKGVAKMKEAFASLAGPILQIVSPIIDLLIPAINAIAFILTPVFDMFQGISKILTGNIESLNVFEGVLGGIAVVTLGIIAGQKILAGLELAKIGYLYAQNALQASGKAGILGTIGALTVQLGISLGILSASLATNAALTFGVGVAVAIAAAAAGYAAIKSLTADDMVSPGGSGSGYGSRTLMGPEGAIALNNKDTVIAGTNLFPKGNDVVSGPAGSVQMQDNSEAKRTNVLLSKLINKPDPVIEMNGDKLGTAVGKYAYSVQ